MKRKKKRKKFKRNQGSEEDSESSKLLGKLEVVNVEELVRRSRLRWFGHVERKPDEDWVKACRNFEVAGKGERGRRKKTWMECVNKDMELKGLCESVAQDKKAWRRGLLGPV